MEFSGEVSQWSAFYQARQCALLQNQFVNTSTGADRGVFVL